MVAALTICTTGLALRLSCVQGVMHQGEFMSIKWKEVLLTIIGGALITLIGVYLIGYTAALTMPKWFSPYILVWEILVVQFLGVGIIAAIVSFILIKVLRFNPNLVLTVLFLSVAVLGALYQGFYHFYWPHTLVLLLCLFIGSRMPYQNA